jgi:hypothetical protein
LGDSIHWGEGGFTGTAPCDLKDITYMDVTRIGTGAWFQFGALVEAAVGSFYLGVNKEFLHIRWKRENIGTVVAFGSQPL